MYLLRKLGIPLAALLILSFFALITVILLYEQNGLQLPSFKQYEPVSPETTVYQEESTSGLYFVNKTSVMEEFLNEQALSNPSY